MRPETAQGIFTNFKNVQQSSRAKVWLCFNTKPKGFVESNVLANTFSGEGHAGGSEKSGPRRASIPPDRVTCTHPERHPSAPSGRAGTPYNDPNFPLFAGSQHASPIVPTGHSYIRHICSQSFTCFEACMNFTRAARHTNFRLTFTEFTNVYARVNIFCPGSVWYRSNRQGVPQRDHAPKFHLPLARVRANGSGVLRGRRRGIVAKGEVRCHFASLVVRRLHDWGEWEGRNILSSSTFHVA